MMDEIDEQDELFQQLRKEYLAEAPARLDELRKDLAAACAREPEALASLRSRFHKLAGSGGSYGFQAITDASREGEHWLLDHPEPGDAGFAWLGGVVGRIAAAFDDAARALGLASTPGRAAFGGRVHVAGEADDLLTRVTESLREALFAVTTGPIEEVTTLPVSERPDLVVVIAGPDQDRLEALSAQVDAVAGQVFGVAMISSLTRAELLGSGLRGVDLMVSRDRAESEVARWARMLGRALSAPGQALLVLPEEAERVSFTQWLEAEGMLVSAVASAAAAIGKIQEQSPDLILVDWLLPGESPAVLVRMLRAAPQTALAPVLVVTSPDDDEMHREILMAGVDAVLVRPISRERLTAEILSRARRTRQLEALLRRDGLTGFLTRSALEDELDTVLAHTRRSGEQIAFVVLDPDHFRRVNEQLGRKVGDQILLHIAQAIRRRIRASDFAIRLGGEEFGILFRQCGPSEALAITNQIRSALLDRPPLVEETPFPIRLSAGIASSGSSLAASARDLIWEAEQALLEAKQTGRDKVVVRS
jgi:diguanylate cyclase (GGDEF)-like protein